MCIIRKLQIYNCREAIHCKLKCQEFIDVTELHTQSSRLETSNAFCVVMLRGERDIYCIYQTHLSVSAVRYLPMWFCRAVRVVSTRRVMDSERLAASSSGVEWPSSRACVRSVHRSPRRRRRRWTGGDSFVEQIICNSRGKTGSSCATCLLRSLLSPSLSLSLSLCRVPSLSDLPTYHVSLPGRFVS